MSGDTLTSIAEQHKTTVQAIWDNNPQLDHQDVIDVGWVLKTEGKAPTRPFKAPTVAFQPSAVQSTGFSQTSYTKPVRGSGGPNAYAWGNCTHYVKERRPDIGGYWGDASGWIYSARSAGYATGSTPSAGAIGVANSYGHVVYVESVNGDGSVNISEQNYHGLGVVSSRTASASEFTYIY